MKTLIMAGVALAAVFLLIPGPAAAQETYYNQAGLYLDPTGPDGSGTSGTSQIATPVLVYLVLTRPVDVQDGNAPYTTINAFEFTLRFDPVPNNNFFVLQTQLPPGNVDVGLRKNINEGFLDFVVGISSSSPLEVFDEQAVLITFTFMYMSPSSLQIFIEPTERPSIAGEIVFQSEPSQLRVMHPASGFFNEPIFEFNGEAVAVDDASFGSVKALFR